MKKYFKALRNTIVIGASFHLVLLFIQAIQTGSLSILNAFSILDIDFYIPALSEGIFYFILSWMVIGTLYLVLVFLDL